MAALGLDPHKHLGKSLQQLEGHLLRLREQYGCNPCGEGGEYETLTLDCPAFVKGRIVLEEWEVRSVDRSSTKDCLRDMSLFHRVRVVARVQSAPGLGLRVVALVQSA